MNKSTIIVIVILAFFAFIIFLPDPNRFDYLKGRYSVINFTVNGKSEPLFDNTLIIDKLSNRLNIGDGFETDKSNLIIGKYDFEISDDETLMTINDAKPSFLNGAYQIKVDTIQFNKRIQSFQITFKSKMVEIVTRKATTYIEL